ncbi:TPA: hypothetical protein SJA06_004736 [Escherichia coli]|nr:hypothetical protein [Escherichia coli]
MSVSGSRQAVSVSGSRQAVSVSGSCMCQRFSPSSPKRARQLR